MHDLHDGAIKVLTYPNSVLHSGREGSIRQNAKGKEQKKEKDQGT